MISVRLQDKPFNITVIQVYAPTSNAEQAEVERFYEDLQDLLELTPKKDVLFIIGDWITVILNGLPWKQTDNSVVFEIAPKNYILDSFVDCEDYSISSKGFLPLVVDIMVI